MKKITLIMTILFSISIIGVTTSCVKASKTCKKNKRKVKSLRKSGALNM